MCVVGGKVLKKNIANNPLSQNEYRNFIASTLSSYEVKDLCIDGKVKRRIVNNDYFLVNDTWNINTIREMLKEPCKTNPASRKNIVFSIQSATVNTEVKLVYFKKLFLEEWSYSTVWEHRATMLKKISTFLNEKYPHLQSLLDINIDKIERQWIWWLNSVGEKTTKVKDDLKYGKIEMKTTLANHLRVLYDELLRFTDSREEWEKDLWDVRVLHKIWEIAYNKSKSQYYLDFSTIKNNVLRDEFKQYLKSRLLRNTIAWGTAQNYLSTVSKFLNFIVQVEPSWNHLKGLTRHHIENFIVSSRSSTSKKNRIRVEFINTFLKDIQRKDSNLAPETPVSKLFLPEDYSKQEKKTVEEIDYIPDYVLEQLFENINDLHKDVQPIVWIAYKSGLRISDTLGLTQDCLMKLNGKYSLVTDIEKTYVKGHRIPIDEELANLIAVLIDQSIKLSNNENNPNKYIFVRYSGKRKGSPFLSAWAQKTLNEFAITKNITDESGGVFHFKNHQFRHTYAVKMLNGGADILTVQELLAHASPEMTMRYARLLDDTKRKAFEEVVKKGVFSFDLNGEIHQVSETKDIPEDILDMMWKDEKLNALDNPYGTCRARVNGNCPLAAEPPCLTANDGKPCFDLAVGMTSFDIKKYELHIESTTKLIEASKEYGRQDMVEANEKNLERYKNIYETIKNGNVIFGRFERMKRQLESKKRKGVKRG
jgi:integrase